MAAVDDHGAYSPAARAPAHPRAVTPRLGRMPTLILVRHGRSTANTAGLLAGWTPGVALDERGAAQAAALPGRLAELPLAEVVSSPLQRCQETMRPLLDARPELRRPHRRADRGGPLRRLVRPQARRAVGRAADGGRAGAPLGGRVPGRRVDARHADPGRRGGTGVERARGARSRRRRRIPDVLARRHHQVPRRGRPRSSSRPLPADLRRTVFHHRDPLHTTAAVSRSPRRHRRFRVARAARGTARPATPRSGAARAHRDRRPQ